MKDGVLVSVERGCCSVIEIANLFVVAEHTDSYFFERAPLIDREELCKIGINLETNFAVRVNL